MHTFVIAQIMNLNGDKVERVRLLDIVTKEVIELDIEEFKREISLNAELYRDSNIYGIYLDEDEMRGDYLSTFVYSIYGEETDDLSDLSLLALKKLNNGVYILTDIDGNIQYIHERDLYKYDLMNIEINRQDEELKHFVLIGVNIINEPQKHLTTPKEIEIDKKYREFVVKNKLFGVDNTFEYKVEDEKVILTNYTGTSTEPTVPRFITKIGNGAFATHWRLYDKYKLDKVYLHEGLLEIDNYAFALSDLTSITIPSTVKVIRRGAFNSSFLIKGHNKGDIDYCNDLDMDRITLLNKNTVIEDLNIKKNIKS